MDEWHKRTFEVGKKLLTVEMTWFPNDSGGYRFESFFSCEKREAHLIEVTPTGDQIREVIHDLNKKDIWEEIPSARIRGATPTVCEHIALSIGEVAKSTDPNC